jgi:hypothetical protein
MSFIFRDFYTVLEEEDWLYNVLQAGPRPWLPKKTVSNYKKKP